MKRRSPPMAKRTPGIASSTPSDSLTRPPSKNHVGRMLASALLGFCRQHPPPGVLPGQRQCRRGVTNHKHTGNLAHRMGCLMTSTSVP